MLWPINIVRISIYWYVIKRYVNVAKYNKVVQFEMNNTFLKKIIYNYLTIY